MHFSIVTPSFRNSNWLKLCIPSIADQGVSLEHIVQDSCSDDGTQEWLPHDSRVSAFIEKDGGMYDGVNRGLRRARGDVLAYLNCDEQYFNQHLVSMMNNFAHAGRCQPNPVFMCLYFFRHADQHDSSFVKNGSCNQDAGSR